MADTSRERRLQEQTERLEKAVREITGGETYRAMLRVAARFHQYSWKNWVLIWTQRPEASRVAGYRTWLTLGRQVKAKERGIRILAPVLRRPKKDGRSRQEPEEEQATAPRVVGFKVVNVFDVSQTEGEPLPVIEVPLLRGEEGEELYRALALVARNRGYNLVERACTGAAGYWEPASRTIAVDPKLSMAQRAKTLAHELAHAAAGHGEPGCIQSIRECETVAESVAFILCDTHGLDTSERSFPYVALYAGRAEFLQTVLADTQALSRALLGELEHALEKVRDPSFEHETARIAPSHRKSQQLSLAL